MCVCVCVCVVPNIKNQKKLFLCKNIRSTHDRTNIYISYTREYIYFVHDMFIYFTKYMRYDISCLLACPATGRFIL